MRGVLLLLLILFSPELCAQNQATSPAGPKTNHDPQAAQLITSDIDNFWKAFDAGSPGNRRASFQRDYFEKGSAGLQAFKRARIDQCSLIETIAAHPGFYAAIRQSTLRVESMKPQIRASFRKLKSLYPDAVFPDVYFLIGCMNSAGTTADAGLLIGTEMYGRTPAIPQSELDSWLKQVLKPIELVPQIVAHELIHYQQHYPAGEKTLLRESIKEGSADFIGELISGGNINSGLHVYADAKERELWDEFRRDMNGTDLNKWLYQGESASDRPADLGYYVGYRICEAYYRNAKDKKRAIREILQVNDFARFLRDSGYEAKFNRGAG